MAEKTSVRLCRKCGAELRVGENATPNQMRTRICRSCSRALQKKYRDRPEVKEKARARMKLIGQTLGYKQRMREYGGRYHLTPEQKEKYRLTQHTRRQRPEEKEKLRQYNRRPEVKEKLRQRNRLYQQRPEVKQRLHEKWLALSPEEKAKRMVYWKKYIKEHNRAPYVPIIDCFEKDWPKTFDELSYASGAGKIYLRSILKQYVQIGLVKDLGRDSFCLNKDSPLRMAADGYFKEATNSTRAYLEFLARAGSGNGGE